MKAELERLLARLKEAESAGRALRSDQELNSAMGPFRGLGPLRVRCGKKGCGRALSWWAFPLAGVGVIFAAHGPRRRHLRASGIPPEQLRPQPRPPFEDWSVVGGWDGVNPSTLADPTGQQERLKFMCKRCGAAYTLRKSKMIELLAEGFAYRQREIVLPHGRERTRKLR